MNGQNVSDSCVCVFEAVATGPTAMDAVGSGIASGGVSWCGELWRSNEEWALCGDCCCCCDWNMRCSSRWLWRAASSLLTTVSCMFVFVCLFVVVPIAFALL